MKSIYAPYPYLYFLYHDHLGSGSWVTGWNGKPMQHIQYTPFGEEFVNQKRTSFAERYTFSGKEKDPETGYSYFGARYYEPNYSIWTSVDPMSNERSWVSPYSYCQNNPVVLVDPTGALDLDTKYVNQKGQLLYETIEAIHKYIYSSDVYIVKNADEIIGVLCLLPIDEQTVEIKNIAVSEKWQGKGIGTRLLEKAEDIAGENNYTAIIVGTADCGRRQIHFYEKNGYTKYAIKKNFFVKNYTKPIYENGMMLKDMIMLKKELKNTKSQFHIGEATISDYPEIMKVWDSVVKATHHFLKAEDFEFYKQIGPIKYLPAV